MSVHILLSCFFLISFNIILLYIQRCTGDLFSIFDPNILYIFPSLCATCVAHFIPLSLIILTLLGEKKNKLWSTSLWNILQPSCYCLPPKSKYSSQCPVLIHPGCVFFLQCETPNLAPKMSWTNTWSSTWSRCDLYKFGTPNGNCVQKRIASWCNY
jgi:hypothetical protein